MRIKRKFFTELSIVGFQKLYFNYCALDIVHTILDILFAYYKLKLCFKLCLLITNKVMFYVNVKKA